MRAKIGIKTNEMYVMRLVLDFTFNSGMLSTIFKSTLIGERL